ncbi:hypothetical protein CP061683_0080, partial [Chlamydia psittaci 06-1683]
MIQEYCSGLLNRMLEPNPILKLPCVQ